MADRFASRAGGVNISRMVRIEDGKSSCRESFRGKVDMLPCQGRRSCEEDLLFKRLEVDIRQRHEQTVDKENPKSFISAHPVPQIIRNMIPKLHHYCSTLFYETGMKQKRL